MPIGTNAVPKINKQQKKVNYNPTFLGGVKKVCPTKMDLDFTKYNPIAKLLGGVTIFIHNLKMNIKIILPNTAHFFMLSSLKLTLCP